MMLSPTSGRLLSSFAALVFAAGLPALASAQTLERIQSAGKIVLGFEANASPFSYADDAGQPNGFAIALCGKVVDEVKAQLGLSDLGVEWKPVQFDTRLDAVRDGAIDLLCGADSITLTRRAEVSFSLPVFPSGTGAMMRADAPAALREILSQDQLTARPIWRGAPARTFLQQKTFAVLPGTVSEGWVKERMLTLQLSSKLLPVNSVDEGIQNVLDGQADVFFGPLPVLLDAALRNAQVGSLAVLNRQFTFEPLGFALARNDEDFRLLVDRALSKTYRSDGFRDLFMRWFGPPDGDLVLFYKQTVLPD
ncbi:amino acid ABC transporter substrate-binding protein [Tabrizicola sp. J26]|nr:amino acid ABC transporter substrate-binding protein [Tabrizicola rongguiensis]